MLKSVFIYLTFILWFCPVAKSQTGAPQQASGVFNPNISLITNILSVFGNDSTLPEKAFNLNEIEVALQAVVDPYGRADIFIGYHPAEEAVEIEEAYFTWLTMPLGLQAKFGKFRSAFSKFNLIHPPETGLADRPSAAVNFLGEEGLNSVGASISWLAPIPDFYLRFIAEVTTIWEEAPAFGTLEIDSSGVEELATSENRDDIAYLGRVETYLDLSEAANISLGGNLATSVNHSIEKTWTRLWGADLTFRWKNPPRAVYRSVTWRTEALFNDREVPAGAEDVKSFGIFSILDWQFAKRWHVGGRYDHSEFPEAEKLNEKGGLAYLSFTPSEYSLVSVQGRYIKRSDGKEDWAGFVKLTFNIGPHGVHPF